MNNKRIMIRQAKLDDLAAIQELFVDTIEAVCRYDYSAEQIAVWTSSIENSNRWIDKLMKQYFLIAEINNKIVGFASLENYEYFDFIYVHKDYQRHGIANNLYSEILAKAIKHGTILLTSDVSITAKPFFEKKGFKVIAEQKNDIKGIEVINYKMTKDLRKE
jgi:putative acetyltransferase